MSEGTVEHQVVVPFAGPGEGTAPLTWGQKAILKDMGETGWTHNASGGQPLDEGTTVDQIAKQLHLLMSKYPALRMRLGFDEQGELCQVVSGSGEIVLDVVDVVGDDVDPGQVVHNMWYSRLLTPFDSHNDWSMRMAVVCHHGVPVYRVWTLNHLVVDGASIGLLLDDIGVGDDVGRVITDPRTVDVLSLGWREQTPAVRRLSDQAMHYWESQLRSIPPLTFGEPTHPEGRLGERFWHGRSNSPAAYLAVLSIAARTRTDTSRVMLAIIAIAVARVMGVNPFVAKVIVSNRFRPGFGEAMAPLSQDSLLSIDLADTTVDEAVARARKASLNAAKYAYYDPAQLDELTARLDLERGYPARVSCRINDRRMQTRRLADEAAADCHVTMEQIQQALPESFISWDGTVENSPEQAFITIEDKNETVYLQLIFDMACFTEAQVEALLRGVEEVAIEAAFDPEALTRVAPAPVLA